MQTKTRGTLEMLAAMAISGTVGWLVVGSGQAPWVVVFWRCVFGALAMLLACAGLGLLRGLRLSGRQVALIALGGCALMLNWVLLFSAYSQASIAVATVVYNTQPFMLVALGALLFGERLTPGKLGWLALAFAGMLSIVYARPASGMVGGDYLLGVLLALGAAFFYAIAAATTKHLREVPAPLIVLLQMLLGILLSAPFALVSLPAPAGEAWFYLVTIGVIHTGLMSTLLYGAIQRLSTVLVGALSFIYPLVAVLVDWLVFGHRLGWLQVLGGAAILLAAAGLNLGWNLRLRSIRQGRATWD
ncbi:DMT family transporter [Pseudomonas sp. MSSRFD41]|uniref:DMT family transporter n=1 Tax=unclassified Pseudomonas TaxID=196821 RepID=UPI00163A2ABB|nr:DMT family transporter [Pseudomonas sp. MSSRFD41]MBC2656398.1 DMT family transporter [Pseudomonas sp. MSSRFD41]